MQHELETEIDMNTFNPEDYLLGIVQRAVASQSNVSISLPGKGQMIVLSGSGVYYADVQNMVEFCSAPAAQFRTTEFRDAVPSDLFKSGRTLKELLWNAAFHASQGRLMKDGYKSDIVLFRHWPNLTRLQASPNAARICALLTRKPISIMLVHRVLCINRAEVYQIYSAASCAGMVNVIYRNPASTESAPEPVREPGLFRLLFAKISGL